LHPPSVDTVPYAATYPTDFESAPEVARRVRERYLGKSHPRRILFLGTSQTWGAGARGPDDAFVARVEAALNSASGPDQYECINGGISALKATDFVELYRDEWLALEPEMLVVNFGFNDMEFTPSFAAALETFATLNRERGIRTVFVLEAASPEFRSGRLHMSHAIMREVAGRHGIPVIDLHSPLAGHSLDGLLFWDIIHLTSFGHRLAAQVILEGLRPLLTRG
jgi:lysophospholipase L1-like esterase